MSFLLIAVFISLLIPAGIIVISILEYRRRARAEEFIESAIKEHCKKNGYKYLGDISNRVQGLADAGQIEKLWGVKYADYGVQVDRKDRQIVLYKWMGIDSQGRAMAEYNVLLTRLEFKEAGIAELRPYEGLEQRPGLIYEKTELNFESAEFSKKFFVNAVPSKFGYDLFSPRVCQFFLDNPDLEFYLISGYLLIVRNVFKKTLSPVKQKRGGNLEFIAWIDEAPGILDKLLVRVPKRLLVKRMKQYKLFKSRAGGGMPDISIDCPTCGKRFTLEKHITTITCPECRARGVI